MKNKKMPKAALPYLIIGLLLVTTGASVSRYYHLPDFVTGFMSGLGLMLEFIAVIKIRNANGTAQSSCSGTGIFHK
jgi:hypothetical protein